MKSKEFFIYPEYKLNDEAQNFDICLIKTPINSYGIHQDLSSQFDHVPCLPDIIDLNEVIIIKFVILFGFFTISYFFKYSLLIIYQ